MQMTTHNAINTSRFRSFIVYFSLLFVEEANAEDFGAVKSIIVYLSNRATGDHGGNRM
jgi:hypothetical protein